MPPRSEVAEGPAPVRDSDVAAESLVVVARRRYLDWIGYAIAAVLVAMFVNNLLTNDRWQWDVIGDYLFDNQVLQGLRRTMQLTVIAGCAGLLVGIMVALMRLSKSRLLRGIAAGYVGFIRAIPGLVLLLMMYFLGALFPRLSLGIPFGPSFVSFESNVLVSQFTAAWLGLTLIVGAHCGEIFRGGVISVPSGQVEAAKALGMGPIRTFVRIVLPQAIRVTIPAIANELISLFKNTSLVSVIGYAELLTVVQLIYGRNYQTLPLLFVAFIWYLVLTTIAMLGQKQLEKRFGRGFSRLEE